ncbi:hypothetical protein EDC16_105185 [Testudinibacter aquarius]|uniref:Uncharacterized protein n=1 Tax=Testudinibacter aquarius TaxID=1524974 RepID=A0A4R3Y633_9PAST|nr:hypothetical protein [Testudinibacter aquarius]TCV87266.1 hypothetical protein EDC16_105185 [Testudinibacter aquarius]
MLINAGLQGMVRNGADFQLPQGAVKCHRKITIGVEFKPHLRGAKCGCGA